MYVCYFYVNEDSAFQEDPKEDEESEEEEEIREHSAGITRKSTDCCLLRCYDNYSYMNLQCLGRIFSPQIRDVIYRFL